MAAENEDFEVVIRNDSKGDEAMKRMNYPALAVLAALVASTLKIERSDV